MYHLLLLTTNFGSPGVLVHLMVIAENWPLPLTKLAFGRSLTIIFKKHIYNRRGLISSQHTVYYIMFIKYTTIYMYPYILLIIHIKVTRYKLWCNHCYNGLDDFRKFSITRSRTVSAVAQNREKSIISI